MTDRDLPRCCEYRGLFYPGKIKSCFKHATTEQRALAAETEDRAATLGVLAGQGWPYGANIDVEARIRMLDWAEAHGLRLANTRCQGLHWLTKGRCAVRICNRLGYWMDHVTRWNWGGSPALILAQPYHLSGDCETQLDQLAADGLRVSVSADGGWYGWRTLAVEVWRDDVFRRVVSGRR